MTGASQGGAPLEIVLHVPKCAGSTIETHLLSHLGERAFWSPKKRSRSLPLELFARKYRDRLPGPAEEVRAVSGHYIGRSVEALFQGRAIRRSVLFREPRALVLSWYNYRMGRYRSLGQAGYPFALHLRSLPPDPLAHFLLAHWLEMPWTRLARMGAGEKLAALEAAFAGFDFVGDVADCDRLIADLSARLGIPAEAREVNTGQAWEGETGHRPLRLADLSEAEADLLDRRTALDRAFWRRVAQGERAGFDPGAAAPFLAAEIARPLAEARRQWLRGRRARGAAARQP